MLEARTINLQGAEQGAQRAAAVGLERERRPAVRARRARVEKGVNLLLEEVALEGAEQVFGLGQGQSEMFDALVVLVGGDNTLIRGQCHSALDSFDTGRDDVG